jgi:isopenicillin N synthase-like dioxygenase
VVVPSPVDNDDNNRRQSMAFFVNINGDAEVVPIETCVDDEHPAKYEMVTAGQYLMQKHLASMGEPFKSHENLDDASLLPLDEL